MGTDIIINSAIPSGQQMLTESVGVDLVEVRANPTRFPRICNTLREESLGRLCNLVIGCCTLKGQTMPEEDVKLTAVCLLNALLTQNDYGTRSLSWVEIAHAIMVGALTADMYGRISAETLYKAIINYIKGEGHEADRKAKARRQRPAEAIPDTAIEALVGHFTDY
jgi:hypothetical protein